MSVELLRVGPLTAARRLLGAVLTCRGDGDPRPAVYQAVKATDWTLVELNQETQTLETIFRKLTQEN